MSNMPRPRLTLMHNSHPTQQSQPQAAPLKPPVSVSAARRAHCIARSNANRAKHNEALRVQREERAIFAANREFLGRNRLLDEGDNDLTMFEPGQGAQLGPRPEITLENSGLPTVGLGLSHTSDSTVAQADSRAVRGVPRYNDSGYDGDDEEEEENTYNLSMDFAYPIESLNMEEEQLGIMHAEQTSYSDTQTREVSMFGMDIPDIPDIPGLISMPIVSMTRGAKKRELNEGQDDFFSGRKRIRVN